MAPPLPTTMIRLLSVVLSYDATSCDTAPTVVVLLILLEVNNEQSTEEARKHVWAAITGHCNTAYYVNAPFASQGQASAT